MNDNQAPLLETKLNYLIRLPVTPREMAAYLDPKKRDDPRIQREIRAEYLQAMWSGGVSPPKPVVPVAVTDEPFALSILRSARAAFGSAADLSHTISVPVISEDSPELSVIRRDSWSLGVVAMPMTDDSLLAYDAITDQFSAWSEWSQASQVFTARREGDAAKPADCSIAEAVRIQIDQGHIDPDFLCRMWLPEEQRRDIARTVDPAMNEKTLRSFLNVEMCPMVDESILVLDQNLDSWRSAADGDACTHMLQIGYAPDRLDKWWRKNVRY